MGNQINKEKFALKIALRGPKDRHCKRLLVEKDAMLMLAPSPWHTSLVVRTNNAFRKSCEIGDIGTGILCSNQW